ncbi:MAG: cytochrome C, partial [Burkholderiales bacterium]|nr:cytochrome C [Burkholderiales bacterium]
MRSLIVALAGALLLAACDTGGSTANTAQPLDNSARHALAPTARQVSHASAPDDPPGALRIPDEQGVAMTFSTTGTIDQHNPFFRPFGNGRSCASCHRADEGWTIRPDALQDLYTQTQGSDPIFALVDGANRPDADISTPDKRLAAFSMLLNRGVIRIGLPMQANAEFDLAAVDDPYGYASARELSMFRRPLPTTNVKFLAAVMWDGRETALQQDTDRCTVVAGIKQCFAPRDSDLMHQANSAIHAHAQATADMSKA